MKCEIAKPEEIAELSRLSVSLGNVPLIQWRCIVSALREGGDIIGFAAVQQAFHAAGSWVHPDSRRKGHTYILRECLESGLRNAGIPVYFAVPGNDFEKELFAKYGPVTEHLMQMKKLGA